MELENILKLIQNFMSTYDIEIFTAWMIWIFINVSIYLYRVLYIDKYEDMIFWAMLSTLGFWLLPIGLVIFVPPLILVLLFRLMVNIIKSIRI